MPAIHHDSLMKYKLQTFVLHDRSCRKFSIEQPKWYRSWQAELQRKTEEDGFTITNNANTQQLRQQNFCSHGTSHMELSSGSAVQSRHYLQIVQTTGEGIPFSGTMNTVLCDF